MGLKSRWYIKVILPLSVTPPTKKPFVGADIPAIREAGAHGNQADKAFRNLGEDSQAHKATPAVANQRDAVRLSFKINFRIQRVKDLYSTFGIGFK